MSVESLITQHIDIWTSAVQTKSTSGRGTSSKLDLYGIKKLRELILELAVCGKLVPQDPNDEPATVLLERIEKEKARLIKAKLIKKPKALPEIEDLPFSIPQSWKWSQLGYLTNYGVCDKAEPKDITNDIWVLELEDVEKVTSRLIQKVYFSERSSKSSKNKFQKSDVIYGKLRPYLDKVLIADEDGVCTTEMIPVRGYSQLIPAYIRLVLKSPYFIKYANDSTHGMNLPRMGTDKARAALFPLAPLKEQHRIVAKVDELMKLCDQLEQQTEASITVHQVLVETLLATLTNSKNAEELMENWQRISAHFDTLFTTEESIDQLKQTILQLAVMGKLVPQNPADEPASELLKRIAKEKAQLVKEGKIKKQKALPPITDDEKPFELPNGWEWCRLDDVVDILSGITKGRKLAGRELKTIPYLSVANVQRGYLNLQNVKEIDLPIDELEKYSVEDGDLLITEGGDWDKVGRTAIWRSEVPYMAHQNHVFKARPFINEQSETWLEMYLNGPFARDYFAGSSKQTTNLASINKTQLRGCLIAVPPMSEKKMIMEKISLLFGICDQMLESLSHIQQIQNLLTDELIEQAI